MGRKQNKKAEEQRNIIYDYLFNHYKDLAINRFKWDNLPNEDDYGLCSEYIENELFDNGLVCAFEHADFGFMMLKATTIGNKNPYGFSSSYRVNGVQFAEDISVFKPLKNEKAKSIYGILVKNNNTHTPTCNTVDFWVKLMVNTIETFKLNQNACKTPFLIQCNDADKLSFENALKSIEGSAEALFGSKAMLDNLNVFNTNVDYMGTDILTDLQTLENKLLTALGINNASIDKKERLITDEVNANNDNITINNDNYYNQRIKAIKKINKEFNCDIKLIDTCCMTVKNNDSDIDDNIIDNDNNIE